MVNKNYSTQHPGTAFLVTNSSKPAAKNYPNAEMIAKDYAGDNVSGKNEKLNIDQSLALFDDYHKIGNQVGDHLVQTYVTGLLNHAKKNRGVSLDLLKSFIAVHDSAKLTENLNKLGYTVTDENKGKLYQQHDNLTSEVMNKIYGFSQDQIQLFNHRDIRAVVDCFDVLGCSPFLKNIVADGQPLLKTLLDSKLLFDEGVTLSSDNLGGIARVMNTDSRNIKNVAEEVFKRQFYIQDDNHYQSFKKSNEAALDNFFNNMITCREENILVSNPRVLFEVLGHQIPQGYKSLDNNSAKILIEALNKFDKLINEHKSFIGIIKNRDGSEIERTARVDSRAGTFIPNRFHYAQGMELFTVPKAKVEGDILETSKTISAV